MIRFLGFLLIIIISGVSFAKDCVTCNTDSRNLSIINSKNIGQIQLIVSKLPFVKGINITKVDPATTAWSGEWSSYIYSALNDPKFSTLMNRKINSSNLELLGCTNYNTFNPDQKKRFLIVFIAAIAETESDFNVDEKTGSNIGLLQISTGDAEYYSGVAVSADDLKKPLINLNKGLYILQSQLIKRNSQLFPEGRIFNWEVLDGTHRSAPINRFKRNLHNLPFCKK